MINQGPLSAFPECDGLLDIGFLVDSSGSITHEKFPQVLQFVRNVSARLEVREGRTRVGLVTYADSSRQQFTLSRYEDMDNLLNAIERVEYRPGRTNTADGLRTIRQQLFSSNNGDREDAPNIVIGTTLRNVIWGGQNNPLISSIFV